MRTDMVLPGGNRAAVDHGGSIGRAKALFPLAPEPFVDLSTGINPHPYPLFELPATALTRLPEAGRLDDLKRSAVRVYGAPGIANVTAAPGTQILLPPVCELGPPGRARVLAPTYAEHARAAAVAGHDVTEVETFEALEGADLAIVVNPNNPDGRVVPRASLLDLAEKLRRKGGMLVVDEAFMDVGPRSESLAADVGEGAIVVLRSFGKFFGLAGVRLGFVLADPGTAGRLEARFGPWAVSGPALEYGIAALSDLGWQDAMRRRLAGEAERLDALLGRFGVAVSGGTPLFRFIDFAGAPGLFRALGEKGILMRHFTGRPAVLRTGLPTDQEEWERLESALADWTDRREARSEELLS